MSYDPARRLRQTVINGVTTQFLYSGNDLIAEMDGAGAILRRYVHGPGVNNPLVWLEGPGMAASGVRYLYKDRLGSITSWTNSAGVVQATFAYGPYGEPKTWGGSRFGYTGQVALSELGLYHYHARVYDPVTGRFLQTDPTGYDDGPNLYIYVGGDPINMVDPLGLAAADGIEEIIVTAPRKPSFDIVDGIKEFFKDIKTLKKISSYISRRIFGQKKKAPQVQAKEPTEETKAATASVKSTFCPSALWQGSVGRATLVPDGFWYNQTGLNFVAGMGGGVSYVDGFSVVDGVVDSSYTAYLLNASAGFRGGVTLGGLNYSPSSPVPAKPGLGATVEVKAGLGSSFSDGTFSRSLSAGIGGGASIDATGAILRTCP